VQFVVGWLNEPAYDGYLNAVQVRLSDDAGPIADVGDALKVEVSFGSQKAGPLPLAPAFGSPGEYRSNMVPTRPGAYTFRFVGTVRGQQIDQSFTSSDKTFDSPKDATEIQFPAKDPNPAQLAGRLDRLDPRIEEVGTAVGADAHDAKSAANRATLIGLAGLLVGLGGLGVAIAGRRRDPSTPAPTAAASMQPSPRG
jgi:hypothetical protein